MFLKNYYICELYFQFCINAVFTQTAYDDDAAEVDYYVPGILG